MRPENGDTGNPAPMPVVSSHHRPDNVQVVQRNQHQAWLKAHLFCKGARSFVPGRIIGKRLLPQRFDAREVLIPKFRDYWHRASRRETEPEANSDLPAGQTSVTAPANSSAQDA